MTEPERDPGNSRRAVWLLVPLALAGAGICGWSLFANVTLGEAESFIAAPLHSAALANYAQDPVGGRLQSLSIRIIEFAIQDREPETDDAGARATEVVESLKSLVPTVTPKPGDPTDTPTPPSTAVPSATIGTTGTPAPTPSPTRTPTRTPSPTPTDLPTGGPSPTATKTPTTGPTPTATKTPTPGPTSTATKTPTASNTPTACKVTPSVYVELPTEGTMYGPGDQIEGHAHAWDPDNVNPANCAATPEDDGSGISEVEFQVKKIVTPIPIIVYTRTEFASQYCAFSGSGTCDTVSVNGGVWPNSTPISAGQYELWARAKDDEGQLSPWTYAGFTIVLPTATPTSTPTATPPTPTTTTAAPSPTPTPTPGCSAVTLTGFNWAGPNIWWSITNGSPSDITLIQFDLSWSFPQTLSKAEMDGGDFWNGTASSPASINSGWAGSIDKRTVAAGATRQLRFNFNLDPVPSDPYTVDLTFDVGCVVSAQVP